MNSQELLGEVKAKIDKALNYTKVDSIKTRLYEIKSIVSSLQTYHLNKITDKKLKVELVKKFTEINSVLAKAKSETNISILKLHLEKLKRLL